MTSNGSWKIPRKTDDAEQPVKATTAEAVVPVKKRKRTGPFRIQTGCVVALRLRPEVQQCRISVVRRPSNENGEEASLLQSIAWDDAFTWIWTKPCIGRDEGLTLIGKRIRCFFPRAPDNPKSKNKLLEGEIIRLVDYGEQQLRGTKRSFTVELLIDKKNAGRFSFLPNGFEGLETGEKTKKQQLEEIIRGKDTVSVIVNLMKPWWMEYQPNPELDSAKFARWDIQKLVPTKLFHRPAATSSKSDNEYIQSENITKERRKSKATISTAARYLGDGNDSADQQTINFQWVASRYHETLLSATMEQEKDLFDAESLCAGVCAEVVKVEPTRSNTPTNGSATSTLAMVTLQRIFLPEQTCSGRLSQDQALSAYQDWDRQYLLKVPVEHLIIISKNLHTTCGASEAGQSDSNDILSALFVSHSYSQANNVYRPSSFSAEESVLKSCPSCHRCRRIISHDQCGDKSWQRGGNELWLCQICISELVITGNGALSHIEKCECRSCLGDRSKGWEAEMSSRIEDLSGTSRGNSIFSHIYHTIDELGIVDFSPPNISPSTIPVARGSVSMKIRPKGPSKIKRAAPGRPPKDIATHAGNESKNKKRRLSGIVNGIVSNKTDSTKTQEDFSVFQATCARFTPYDRSRIKKRDGFSTNETRRDKPRSLREKDDEKGGGDLEKEEKTTSGRAARANQRRVIKSVASLGSSTALNIDTLACREPQLRFDRSGIHAWGVFADEDIAAGEMILEYRGEIIGNSIAEKREVEYEAANIGSDYMFRIDATTVCDATKLGCVARFINASCEPNCHTKIITLDGSKRIVIYAKRTIRAGEELCYDYKFPLEFDEKKRIPCYCGAKDCRGYMNWDKKYVAVPTDPKVETNEAGKTNGLLETPRTLGKRPK
ncbi:histone-lysine N-methyltransferase SETD1 [Fistulifera solaris]|uniref:[histone H3]-lysine(4) N-trimethyltransferase n=1 Tax=Fistulifera solaris TaxID=1519565 RepID=A0A1Z5JEZ5_FISSO|nr:histone-lysine N-methyltransferase SETD1 [Fistulifera solaris]|eukprot:GAX12338.1 histone-lysine N-methyltransferase SETD1 [Fistulifera solaris]